MKENIALPKTSCVLSEKSWKKNFAFLWRLSNMMHEFILVLFCTTKITTLNDTHNENETSHSSSLSFSCFHIVQKHVCYHNVRLKLLYVLSIFLCFQWKQRLKIQNQVQSSLVEGMKEEEKRDSVTTINNFMKK